MSNNIFWGEETTPAPVPVAEPSNIYWGDEEVVEPSKDADALAISEQVIKDFPNDRRQAQKELTKRLTEAGVDIQEIEDRTSAFNRFQTGLSKSLISAYNGITGAEKGDISYDMETRLNKEAEEDSKLYKAMNPVNKLVRDEEGNYTGETKVVQDQELATTLGEVAPVVASGIAGGAVGAGSVTSAIGAGIADVAYTGAQAMSEQSDVGAVEVALSAVFGAAGASMARILNPKNLKEFTTIDKMPKAERKAVIRLAEESGLSKAKMEQKILDYKKSTQEGTITNRSAVEGAAKASEKEQTGFATDAMMMDTKAKKNVIEEATKRTKVIEDALIKMDTELELEGQLERIIKRHTIDDEGRRKATDWDKLATSLSKAGLTEEDEVYKRVLENSKTFGSKETDLFQATVRPAKTDTGKAIELVQPFTETTRASMGSQLGATGIGIIDRVLTFVMPNADTKTVKMIRKAMLEVKTPKELESKLIDKGINRIQANRFATEMADAMEQDAKDDLARQTAQAKEAKKELADEVADWASERKVPTDLNKKLTRAKQKGDRKEVEAIQKEVDDRLAKEAETSKKSAINAGIEADNKAREASIAKKAKVEADTQAKKVSEAKKREDEYAKQADEEAIRVGIEQKASKAKKIEEHKNVSAKWEDENTGLLKGKTKQYNLAKQRYQKAIGTEDEATAKKALDDIRLEATEARNAVLEKKAIEKSQADEADAMSAGIKAESEEAKSVLTPKQPKQRKPTQNQIDAQKAKEANPDDKEEIVKQLTKKSPAKAMENTAENALAKETAELENFNVAKKTISPKKVNTIDDMDNLKEVVTNPNSTQPQKAEAMRRRRAVASRETWGNDDLAVKYKEWADDTRSGFGDFIVEKKADLKLDYKDVEKYYEVQGTNVPSKVKKAYTKEEGGMKAGIGKEPKVVSQARSTLGKSFTKEIEDTLMKSKDRTRAMKGLFTKGKLTQTQIENVYEGKVPNDIKRSTKWE